MCDEEKCYQEYVMKIVSFVQIYRNIQKMKKFHLMRFIPMKLFEISGQYQKVLEEAINVETGEIDETALMKLDKE